MKIGTQESLRLEFKGGLQLKGGMLERTAKEALAGSLSSFANSAGGILIFGVDCRKVDRVDCAQSLVPIENLAAALTTMTDFVAEALQPRHDSISVRAIGSATKHGDGYIVLDVPQSSRRPHMNQFSRTYHKRAGSSKFQMEHYDVEDAFRRLLSPELTAEYDLIAEDFPSHHGGTIYRFTMRIAIRNVGSGLAQHIALRHATALPVKISDYRDSQLPAQTSIFGKWKTCSFPGLVIHPGSTTTVRNFYFSLEIDSDDRAAGTAIRKNGNLRVEVGILAEGMPLATTILEVPNKALRSTM